MIAFTIIKGIVTCSVWQAIRIRWTNKIVFARRSGLEWDTFVFPMRFVVSIVTGAIVKVVITPTVRDAVRVGGTNVAIGTPEKSTCFLKRGGTICFRFTLVVFVGRRAKTTLQAKDNRSNNLPG